jgi:hypothetical protein
LHFCLILGRYTSWLKRAKLSGSTPIKALVLLLPMKAAIEGRGYRSLNEGQEVEFEVKDGPKGPQAAEIRPL